MARGWPIIGVSMKRINRCLIVAAAWAGVTAAALAPAANESKPMAPAAKEGANPPSADELVRRLGDDSWEVREQATHDLWLLGENAEASLKQAMISEDPEVVRRARDLADKIDLGLLPDTPLEVAELVRSYLSAEDRSKSTIIRRLLSAKAWRQVLKLYGRETSPVVRKSTRSYVSVAVLRATREALADDDEAKALGFLEMAPNDVEGLAAWAAFHAARGSARDELKRLRGADGVLGAQSRMSLLRALGDLQGTAREAESAGEPEVVAAMHLLQGDPLPWLRMSEKVDGRGPFREAYLRWAIERWETGTDDREIVDSIVRACGEVGEDDLWRGVNVLFSMGESAPAEKWLEKIAPSSAAVYYDTLERFDDFLRVMGLDPDKPDFQAWTEKRTGRMLADPDHTDEERDELVLLCGVLETRGWGEKVESWLEGYLDALAKENHEMFLDVLGSLFSYGVNTTAMSAAVRYAGEDMDRWEQVAAVAVRSAGEFAPGGEAEDAPGWIDEQTKELPAAQRLRVLMAMVGLLPGETKLRAEWIERLREVAGAEQGGKREHLLVLLLEMIRMGGEFKPALELASELAKDHPESRAFSHYVLLLSAGGRWEEAVDQWRQQVAASPDFPVFHAYLAATLRRTGREDEALREERTVKLMALADGPTCVGIGQAYASTGDFARAGKWWSRALIEAPPRSSGWLQALELMRTEWLEKRNWKLAAVLCETMVIERVMLGRSYMFSLAAYRLRGRFDADFAKAMDLLPKDRKRALRLIDECDELLPTDGSVADQFLPALREEGLIAEHDRYFDRAWKYLEKAIRRFPDAVNTRNTAAWIAARARLRLDEAAAHIDRALSESPNQPAYLDTRAEVWFALGNRKKALEWSRRAVEAEPGEVSLRRQFERFRSAPLPD